jgi:hypothetical protein
MAVDVRYVGTRGVDQWSELYSDPSNTYDPGGRLGQLMFRINW